MVLHHGFLSSPSGCLLSHITMRWQCGHRLCLLHLAWWMPCLPCCVLVQPPLRWVVGQDIADQFCNNYYSILRPKIIIFCAWHPLVSKTKFTEMEKYLSIRYDNSEGLTGESDLSGSSSRSVIDEEAAPGLCFHWSSQGGQDASFTGVTVHQHQVFWKLIHLLALAGDGSSKEGWYKLKFKQLKCDFGSLSS